MKTYLDFCNLQERNKNKEKDEHLNPNQGQKMDQRLKKTMKTNSDAFIA